MKMIAHYRNGGSVVTIFDNGTKYRRLLTGMPPHFPEQLDVKITNWCDAGCAWCHENSDLTGHHADLNPTYELLRPLHRGTELAIGGGDPLSHPQFDDFVAQLSQQGFICNVTVNGLHYEKYRERLIELARKRYIWGIGLSFSKSFPSLSPANMVHHMIVGIHHPDLLKGISAKKLLLLGYKSYGRGAIIKESQSRMIERRINDWKDALPHLIRNHHISMDTLAIHQLEPRSLFETQQQYDRCFMGEEGQYSFYLDAVEQTYAMASYASERFPYSDIKTMFDHVRSMKIAS